MGTTTITQLPPGTSLNGTELFESVQDGQSVRLTAAQIAQYAVPSSPIPVSFGGTGSTSLTGYVKGAGITSLQGVATIPLADISGAGTAASKDLAIGTAAPSSPDVNDLWVDTSSTASYNPAAGYPVFSNPPALLSDAVLSYTPTGNQLLVTAGMPITTSDLFAYTVAASSATDAHVITAGGVKLYVQPGLNGFNVMAFGATAGGSLNDTTAIQSAINAAHGTWHPAVYIPSGLYAIDLTTSLILRDGVTITGSGRANSQLIPYQAVGGTFIKRQRNTGSANAYLSNVVIQDIGIIFEHPTVAAPTNYVQIGIDFHSVTRSFIERCYIGNYPTGASVGVVSAPTSQANARQGVGVIFQSTSAGDPAYAGGEVNTVRDTLIVGVQKGVTIDDPAYYTPGYSSASYAFLCDRTEVQIAEVGIAQWSQYGAGGSVSNCVVQSIGKATGSSNTTYGIYLNGYEHLVSGGYNEVGPSADYELYLGPSSKRNRILSRLTGTGTVTDAGQRNYIDDVYSLMPGGSRCVMAYNDANSVSFFGAQNVMGGFRFRGQYTKGPSPVFPAPTSKVASMLTHLTALSSITLENWYAVFLCANSNDSVSTIRIMPYLRAGSVAGSVVTFQQFAEGWTGVVAQTYAWSSTNNLANTDILVISDNGRWSGRVAKVTANTTTTMTLNTIGGVRAGDTFLPAPPGYDHYVYVGSFYFDTAEVRNFYDTGTVVATRGIDIQYPASLASGSIPATGTSVDATGYISPLASAVRMDSIFSLSTASTGTYAEYFAGDSSNHVVQQTYFNKNATTTQTYVGDGIQVAFLYPQQFWYYNAGTLVASKILGSLHVRGWIEA